MRRALQVNPSVVQAIGLRTDTAMTRVVLALSQEEDDETQHVYAHVEHSPEYYFLYPDVLALERETGQLVDPQTTSFFIGHHLDALDRFVSALRPKVAAQPQAWSQRVGEQYPARTPVMLQGSREELFTLVDGLAEAISAARKSSMGVLFTE